MKAKIVKIGNSKGVRIPKALLEQVGLEDEVLLEATNDSIVIRSSREPRSDWAERFKAMTEHGDDRLLDSAKSTRTKWERDEWQW